MMASVPVSGHKKFGHKRQVHHHSPDADGESRLDAQTQLTLDELFRSSTVLSPHLEAFRLAGIDGSLALQLTEAHLREVLHGAALGERIRVHTALCQLTKPAPPAAGREDERQTRMFAYGSWNQPAVQHVIGLLDSNVVIAALFLTIAAAALIAPPTECRDIQGEACETLMAAETISWSVTFALLFASVIECMAVTLLLPALTPEESAELIPRNFFLFLGFQLQTEVGGSVGMFVGIIIRVLISVPQRVAVVAGACLGSGMVLYLVHCITVIKVVFRCKLGGRAFHRIVYSQPRAPKRTSAVG